MDAVLTLSTSAAQPDWSRLENIDVPLRQSHVPRCLSNFAVHRCNHQSQIPNQLHCPATCWRLAKRCSLGYLHIQDREFRCCLRYWLGIPLHNSPHCCPACHTIADEFGDHHVGCGGNGDRITRHNAIRDVLFSAAQSAALSPAWETNGLIYPSRHFSIYLAWWSTSSPCHLATPTIYCTRVSWSCPSLKGSSPLIYSLAAQLEWHSFHWL